MGTQALVVFVGLTIAMAVGIVAGTLEAGARLAGWLAIGVVPVAWALMRLTERVIGREIWHYTAPYPYRRMQVATVAEAPHRQTAPESEVTDAEPEEMRLAA